MNRVNSTIPTVQVAKSKKAIPKPSIERGEYSENDVPSKIAKGVWKNRKTRLTADEIRTKAWQRN
jgi:hypothetical protein